MTLRSMLRRLGAHEDLNFLLTNRLPRRWVSQIMGRLSQVEQPLVRDLSIAVWKAFCDVDMSDAEPRTYRSLHDCFIRKLRPGSRPVETDPRVLCSPCDAIVGRCGHVEEGTLLQAKGFSYPLADLLADRALAGVHAGARYVTLRLTAGMYHRFHAPADAHIEQVDYISGDTWNVNPIALQRVERLFCRNERAVIRLRLADSGEALTLVPVAAILVASLRLSFADIHLHLRYRGPNRIPCDVIVNRGQELGWFEHGSTVIVLAPGHYEFPGEVREGARIRMGEPLLMRPDTAALHGKRLFPRSSQDM